MAFLKILGFPIDQILFRSVLFDNQIALTTSLCFVFIGSALLSQSFNKSNKMVQVFCVLVIGLSFLAILGYVFSVKEFYGHYPLTPMALNTAMAFMMSALSILFLRPNEGIMKVFTVDSASGHMSRVLIFSISIIPTVFGKFIVWCHDNNYFDERFGFTLFNALLTVSFVTVIYFISKKLNSEYFLVEETRNAMLNVMEDLEVEKARLENC